MYYSTSDILKAEHDAIENIVNEETSSEDTVTERIKGIFSVTKILLSMDKEGG